MSEPSKPCDICFNNPCDCQDLFEPYNEIIQNELQQKRHQITNIMFQISHAESMLDFFENTFGAMQKTIPYMYF